MIKKVLKKSIKAKKKKKTGKQVIKKVIHKLSTGKKTTSKKRLRKIFIPFIVIIFFITFIMGIYFYGTTPNINDLKAVTRKSIITLKDDKDDFLSIIGNHYEYPIDINKINPLLKKALVVTEDKRFYEHGALDYFGIIRAVFVNLKAGYKKQGGSTITQQLAKNLFLSNEKSLSRKIREALLAYKLEGTFTKDEILEIYLNRAYFGFGVYGINSAAKRYYDKSAYGLTLYEMATLIGMLKAPNGYNPILNFEKSQKRARLVLSLMGYDPDNIKVSKPINNSKRKSGYFIDYINSEVRGYLGEVSQDIEVKTTFDKNLQSRIENIIKDTEKPENLEIAVVALNYDGAIKAMVGGVDYQKSEYNRAYQSKRQIGSTVKPFVYLAGFDKGILPSDYMIDSPVKGFDIKNYNNNYMGEVTVSEAFEKSLNTIAVKIAKKAGIKNIKKTLMKFGLNYNCVNSEIIALGVCGSNLTSLTASYASIANGGYMVNPYGFTSVLSKNDILYERKSSSKIEIANHSNILLLDEMLENVVKQGTGKNAQVLNKVIRGKTGTTQNGRDAYFIGYDNNLVVGVWVGYDNEKHTKFTGGGLPAKIFKKIMEVYY